LNVVLFPGATLPLHIFEERYKLLIGRCLEEKLPFGVVLIRKGNEVGEPGEPFDVGCTAHILRVQHLQEGRMNLLCRGGKRFRPAIERPYRWRDWAAREDGITGDELIDMSIETLIPGALADADGRWLITLDGLGGVGKTALAREATKQTLIAGRFNDLVWETAQRERFAWSSRQPIARPALTFEMLLDAIAVQLNHADIRRQPLDRKKADIRFLLCEAPYLIVLDNLETADDVQPMVDELWPLTNPSKVLLTSRERLTRYEQNHSIHVTALDANAAIALMRYHGAERGIDQILQATDETLLPIQDVTAGNPLAIKLVVGLVERRPLANVLAALQKATGEAREFYTFIYRYSWDKLSKAGQALLLNMPHLPPGGGDWDDLLAVSGLPEPDLSPAVDELIGLSLLNVGGPDEHRYSIHPLTRHFILSELVQS